MANMNGLDFVKNVHEKYGTDTPIVMITTEGSDEVVNDAKSRGANGYVNKPFTQDKVQEVSGDLIS